MLETKATQEWHLNYDLHIMVRPSPFPTIMGSEREGERRFEKKKCNARSGHCAKGREEVNDKRRESNEGVFMGFMFVVTVTLGAEDYGMGTLSRRPDTTLRLIQPTLS